MQISKGNPIHGHHANKGPKMQIPLNTMAIQVKFIIIILSLLSLFSIHQVLLHQL